MPRPKVKRRHRKRTVAATPIKDIPVEVKSFKLAELFRDKVRAGYSIPDVVVPLSSPQDIEDFIVELREAKKNARNGGLYRVFRKNQNGDKAVFAVQFGNRHLDWKKE